MILEYQYQRYLISLSTMIIYSKREADIRKSLRYRKSSVLILFVFCVSLSFLLLLVEMRVASIALSSLRKAAISRSVPVTSFSLPIRSFATYKTSTGLAGVDVDPVALNTVHKLSIQILENVKVYQRSTTQNCYRYFILLNLNIYIYVYV